VTPPLPKQWSLIQSLAYDAEEDRLFAVDLQTGQLLHIARGSGVVTPRRAPELTGRKGVRSLAFHPELRLLFAADYETDRLLVIEPETGHLSDSMVLRNERGGRIEELQFFKGELYAMRGLLRKGELVGAQLQRINLRTGTVANVGPRIQNVSPHALLVNSVPEDYRWAQVGGPATAAIDYTRGLDTAVVFPVVGRYEFELRVGDAADRVTVDVVEVGASTSDERDGAHSLALRQVRAWTPFRGRSLAPTWRLGDGSRAGAAAFAEAEVFVWRRGYDGPCGDREPVAGVAVAARR
jgi:hypothetical protein